MRRPVGVVLVCLVLGGFAALQVLGAALYAVLAFAMRHGFPAGPFGQATMPPAFAGSFLMVVMLVAAMFLAAVAAWAITTIVGLVRLRSWARYSVLAIGGCLAALGTISLLGVALFSGAGMNVPHASARVALGVRLALVFVDGMVLFIGLWWLVYFNLRSIRAVFGSTYSAQVHGLGADASGSPNLLVARRPGRFQRVPVAILVLGACSCSGVCRALR